MFVVTRAWIPPCQSVCYNGDTACRPVSARAEHSPNATKQQWLTNRNKTVAHQPYLAAVSALDLLPCSLRSMSCSSVTLAWWYRELIWCRCFCRLDGSCLPAVAACNCFACSEPRALRTASISARWCGATACNASAEISLNWMLKLFAFARSSSAAGGAALHAVRFVTTKGYDHKTPAHTSSEVCRRRPACCPMASRPNALGLHAATSIKLGFVRIRGPWPIPSQDR